MSVEQAFERLRQANPLPDPSGFEAVLADVSETGRAARGGNRNMRTDEITTDRKAPERRRTGWITWGAAALVMIVVGASLLTGGWGQQGSTTEPLAAPAERTPLQIAEAYMEARVALDAETARALLDSQAVVFDFPQPESLEEVAPNFEYLRRVDATYSSYDCIETMTGRNSEVTCLHEFDTRLHRAAGVAPMPAAFRFRIRDGRIVLLNFTIDGDAFFEEVLQPWLSWLDEQSPTALEDVYRRTHDGGLANPVSDEALDRFSQYLEMYEASQG